MIGLQYMLGLSLRRTGLGCTWNLPSIFDTSTTAVHLDGMQIDLDSASVFPSKFSSVSNTRLSSMHSFLVSCLVHPTVMAFSMVVSAPDDRSTHFCTHYKGVCKCMFIYCEIKCCDSPYEHVMTSRTFEGGHKTSFQVVDLELFISVQVHATSFCTSIQ